MSDPQHGEPVQEPASVEDVVGSVNESLAEAEAAGRDAVADAADSAQDAAAETAAAPLETAEAAEAAPAGDSTAGRWDAELPAWAADAPLDPEPIEGGPTDVEPVEAAAPDAATVAYAAETAVSAPAVTPSEPIAPAAFPSAAQPIFVQAPEAPRPRGNRAAAGAIGLIAAVAFGVLYLAVWLGIGAIEGTVTGENIGATALDALGTWSLWVPVVVFFIAFWLLGAIINRGRWGSWVIFGLLVGVASYGGHILGDLFQAPFWLLTASEGAARVQDQLLAPLAVAAFVIGRELTIWFGAWVAARGKRVTELNLEAQHEYERTLEAGPQLVRS